VTPTTRQILERERDGMAETVKRAKSEMEGLEKNLAAAMSRLEANQQHLDNLNKDLETE